MGMILIPFILVLIAAGILRHYYYSDDESLPHEYSKGRDITEFTAFITTFNKLEKENPHNLNQLDTITNLEQLLPLDEYNLLIKKENSYIYRGNSFSESWKRDFYLDHYESQFIIRTEIDGEDYIFNVVELDRRERNPITLLIIMVLIITILFLTNSSLTYVVLKSITSSISKLKNEAVNIKAGNLSNEITYSKNDEFTEVFQTFDEMRVRLKDSIDSQIRYEENRKELVSSISHDLRTPMTTIKGYIEGINDGVANSPERLKKYLRAIYSKTEVMNNLIDEFFLFSKLDLNKINFHLINLDLKRVVEDFLDEFSLDSNADIDYIRDDSEQILVVADKVHLFRVLTNLFDNAVKYQSSEKLSIKLTIRTDNKVAIVEIEDNGIGIDKDQAKSIFDSFYRIDSSRNSSGSGLGLAIVKEIIKGMNGNIWASGSIGKGTKIGFSLPLGGNFEQNFDHRR